MENFIQWITAHGTDLIALIVGVIGVLEVIARLTPTDKDNSIVETIKRWFDWLLPNRAKNGEVHVTESARKRRKNS